jgi:hypothetical protein
MDPPAHGFNIKNINSSLLERGYQLMRALASTTLADFERRGIPKSVFL